MTHDYPLVIYMGKAPSTAQLSIPLRLGQMQQLSSVLHLPSLERRIETGILDRGQASQGHMPRHSPVSLVKVYVGKARSPDTGHRLRATLWEVLSKAITVVNHFLFSNSSYDEPRM